MGIYTRNRYLTEAHDWASEIPANEAYGAAIGCAQIIADCQANDMALFESTIYNDFAEVKAVQEGVDYVNENAFTNVIKKIVEMFKKLIAKIKGIFAAFITKLTGAFTDGKKLVKKYEKQIIKYGNWKEFKCKGVRVPNDTDILGAIDRKFATASGSSGVAGCYKITIATDGTVAIGTDNMPSTLNSIEAIDKADTEDIKEAILKKYFDEASDYSEFHTNVMDHFFKDEDTIDGDDDKVTGSYFSAAWIKGVLNADKQEKKIKKYNEQLEKNINTIIDNLNKCDDNIADWITKNPNKKMKYTSTGTLGFGDGVGTGQQKVTKNTSYTDKFGTADAAGAKTEEIQKAIHVLQKFAGNEQEVITKVTSEYMAVYKFAFGQARKVWTAAAAWSSGVHKESVEYTQAVAESAMEQFYVNMEAIH